MMIKITTKNLLAVLIVMMSMMWTSASTANAESMPLPQQLMKDASDKMLKALKDNKQQLEEEPSVIYDLVQEILMPNFDFYKMSKLALGKNWRQANEEQRELFVNEFRLLLVRTYSTAMLEYTDEEIRFLPFHDDLSSKRVKVAMEIIQPAGPSIPMSVSMYQNDESEWKVYDVKIDGISLVTNYRSTFSTQIRNEGIENLIKDLASRNKKVKA